MESNTAERERVSCSRDVVTRDWHAWVNAMPPEPGMLFVRGEVQVANPGVEAVLCASVPQGINPSILLLDLYLVQRPGEWPQQVTWKTARYLQRGTYNEVNILSDGETIAQIPVLVVP